jgi:hypothetical protein
MIFKPFERLAAAELAEIEDEATPGDVRAALAELIAERGFSVLTSEARASFVRKLRVWHERRKTLARKVEGAFALQVAGE